ncbi:hypothetical protein [Acidocella sp.]|uniref:hypothetical protein n=1 Tax=Acidocella sp. TaxID=50710 RepID=UPI0026087032|nr:hypothetical protein [Acidocella sp.]
MTDATTSSSNFNPAAVLNDLLSRANGLVLCINEALAALNNTEFKVPGETTDYAAYRKDRREDGPLSDLGKDVMLSLLKLGLTDEEVGIRMKISPNGVAERRRRWGRAYAQKG